MLIEKHILNNYVCFCNHLFIITFPLLSVNGSYEFSFFNGYHPVFTISFQVLRKVNDRLNQIQNSELPLEFDSLPFSFLKLFIYQHIQSFVREESGELRKMVRTSWVAVTPRSLID